MKRNISIGNLCLRLGSKQGVQRCRRERGERWCMGQDCYLCRVSHVQAGIIGKKVTVARRSVVSHRDNDCPIYAYAFSCLSSSVCPFYALRVFQILLQKTKRSVLRADFAACKVFESPSERLGKRVVEERSISSLHQYRHRGSPVRSASWPSQPYQDQARCADPLPGVAATLT
jgi:hypothetical protein